MANVKEINALLSDDVIGEDKKDDRFRVASDKKAAKILESVKKKDIVPIDQTPFEAPSELVEGDGYKGQCFLNEEFRRNDKTYKIIWPGVPFEGTKEELPTKVEMKHLMHACEKTEDGVDYDQMITLTRLKDDTVKPLTAKRVRDVCKDAIKSIETALSQGKKLPLNKRGQIRVSFDIKNESSPSGFSTHLAKIPFLPKFIWNEIMERYKVHEKTSNGLVIEEDEDEDEEEEEKEQKSTEKAPTKKSETPQRDEQQQRLEVAKVWKGNDKDYSKDEDEDEDKDYEDGDGDGDEDGDEDSEANDERPDYDPNYDAEEAMKQEVSVPKQIEAVEAIFNSPDASTAIKNRTRLKKKIATAKASKESTKSSKKDSIPPAKKRKSKAEEEEDMDIDQSSVKSKPKTKPKPKSKPKAKPKPKPKASSKKRKQEEESEQESGTEMDIDDQDEDEEESEMEGSSKARKSGKGSGYTRERQKRGTVIHRHLNYLAKRYKEIHGSNEFPDPFEYLQDAEDVKTFFEKLPAEKAKPHKEQFHFLLAYLMNYTTTRNSLHPLSRPKKKIAKKSKKEPPSAFAMSGFDFD